MNYKDETGNIYGRLTVIAYAGPTKRKQATWHCRCQCGNTIRVSGSDLRSGSSTKCRACANKLTKTTHGVRSGPVYRAYYNALDRCRNPNNKHWGNYGGRGILFDLGSFIDFKRRMEGTWFEKATLGRIDNSKGYSYDNIRWETRHQQARNTRSNRWITYGGQTMILSDWAAQLGINTSSMIERINKWGVERALTTMKRTK